jgi:pyruvate,water dikinase
MDAALKIIPLAAASDEATFGGKAVSLSHAIRAGLPVPPGAALGAPFVDGVASGNAVDVAELMRFADLPNGRLAVRSSAVGEDGSTASFAGQHATKLNVVRVGLPAAVREVWQSARSASALAYRARKGLSPTPMMGVVVQRMVEPIAAGVLFTCNPMTGEDERMIEATWGLGEAVVSGRVTPDLYRMDTSGRLLEATPGHKDVKVWYGDDEGTVEVPVAAELHTQLCLDSIHLAALHELAERCHAVWGSNLDIEWALDGDGVVQLLQCRPITTLRPPLS